MKKHIIRRMGILLLLGLVMLTMTVSGATIIPICTNKEKQELPDISNDTIVWQDYRNGNWDIYKWDSVNGEERVTTDPANQQNPAISNGTIVWQDYRNGNWDIYKWDSVNGEERVTTNPKNQINPDISNDTIVWEDYRDSLNGKIYIYKWDSVNGEERVPASQVRQFVPAISNGTIVWQGEIIGGGFEIYMWDPVTKKEERITNEPNYQEDPAISDGTIVWRDSRLNNNMDIYKWDSVNDEERVTTNPANQQNPAISGSTIVWEDARNANPSIYKWNPKNNQEQRVTIDPLEKTHPAISDGTIVWQDARNDNWDIYAAVSIDVTSPNGGENWARGTSHTITWDYSSILGPTVKIVLVQGENIVSTINPSTSIGSNGKGSYTWDIPSDGITGSGFKVSVQSLSQPTVIDMSDDTFTLTPGIITVTAPNGREIWYAGTEHMITWSYRGSLGKTVKIRLTRQNPTGLPYPPTIIADNVPIGSVGKGLYRWTIPLSQAHRTCKVSVQSISQPTIEDTSDNSFAVTPLTTPSIMVTVPNGGETWQRGTSYTIQWIYAGSLGKTVTVVLLKRGKPVGTINARTSIGSDGKGSCTWDIYPSGTIGSDYKVGIASISQPTINDTSESYFTLTSAITTPSNPVTMLMAERLGLPGVSWTITGHWV